MNKLSEVKKYYELTAANYKDVNQLLNDPFNIYKEKFFLEIYPQDGERSSDYGYYLMTLNEWIKEGKSIQSQGDLTKFKLEIKKRSQQSKKSTVKVLFVTPVANPSRKILTSKEYLINDINIRLVAGPTFRKKYKEGWELLLKEYQKHPDFPDIKKIDFDYYFHFFTAEVSAQSSEQAVDRVEEAFSLLSNCITVAHEGYKRTFTIGGEFRRELKLRAPLPSARFFVTGSQAFVNSKPIIVKNPCAVNSSIDLYKKSARRFRHYLKIVQSNSDTPIDEIIRLIIKEFGSALESIDPQDRFLRLWRCLELAYSFDGRASQEKILKFIGNLYTDNDWKIQGELVAKFRNGHVHQGHVLPYEVRDTYLAWVQEYVATTLSLFLSMRKEGIGNENAKEIKDFLEIKMLLPRQSKGGLKLIRKWAMQVHGESR